jgi:rubrerythrin
VTVTDQPALPGIETSRTLGNLKEAYLREAQACLRYLFCARQADQARQPVIAQTLRTAADEERGHAFGFLDLMIEHGAQVSELVSATLADNLDASIEAELHEFSALYTHYAEVAAQEGYAEIAQWFLALAEAGRTHARWLQQCLDSLVQAP